MVVVFLLIFNYRALPKVVKPFIIRAELSRRPETGKAGKRRGEDWSSHPAPPQCPGPGPRLVGL